MSIGRAMNTKTATIANGAAVSDVINTQGFTYMLIITPAEWTDANIGFKVSADNSTFVTLYDEEGAPVQVGGIATAAAGAYVAPAEVAGARFVKLWSKSSTAATETDTNQGAARSIVVELTA